MSTPSNIPFQSGENGIDLRQSRHSVTETIDRLESALRAKGLVIFARIDQAAEAAKVGLQLRPTQLLIYGSPKAGTPLMDAVPSLALDLPLKALAWEDAAGQVTLATNSGAHLKKRHGLTDAQVNALTAAEPLLNQAVE